MNSKTKLKIRLAVKDYMKMFPEDWELCKWDIEYQRQNLKNDFASLDTHMLQRALFSIPEKLSTMIAKKLTNEEIALFKEKEHARWFANEFKQFAITKEI